MAMAIELRAWVIHVLHVRVCLRLLSVLLSALGLLFALLLVGHVLVGGFLSVYTINTVWCQRAQRFAIALRAGGHVRGSFLRGCRRIILVHGFRLCGGASSARHRGDGNCDSVMSYKNIECD